MAATLALRPRSHAQKAASSQPAEKSLPEVVVGGLRVARIGRTELAALMVSQCLAQRQTRAARPRLVFAANGQVVSLAARNPEFRRRHEVADIVHADGQPLVFAARWLTRTPISERCATTDFFHDAAAAARASGLKFFLLGGPEEVNARCAEQMRTRYPGLAIVGHHHGYFSPAEEPAVCDAINRSGADVVWVGMGVPREQDFCFRNRDRLTCAWLVTAGGCFHYVTGDYARAPLWMQRAGLEWLHRLGHEPGRLLLRYLFTNPHALWLLLMRTQSVKARSGGLATEKPQLNPG